MPLDGVYPLLPERGCLYIEGDDPVATRCGCARRLNSSYCSLHHKLCHVAPGQKAAAEAEIDALGEKFGGRSGDRLSAPPSRFLVMLSEHKPRSPKPAWEREFDLRLGRNISSVRKAKGLSSAAVAGMVGIPAVRYWNWEQGVYGIGIAWLQLIADALGVTSVSLIPPVTDLNPCSD